MNNEDIFQEAEGMPEGLQFLTYEDVARILKVKRATVRSWVYRGVIRTNVKMGNKSLIPISELRRFVAAKTRQNEVKVFPIKDKPKVEEETQTNLNTSPTAQEPQDTQI